MNIVGVVLIAFLGGLIRAFHFLSANYRLVGQYVYCVFSFESIDTGLLEKSVSVKCVMTCILKEFAST